VVVPKGSGKFLIIESQEMSKCRAGVFKLYAEYKAC